MTTSHPPTANGFPATDVVGVVLAGGESTRMGQDKALIQIAGITLLERAARTLASVTATLVIAGRDQPAWWPADLPATFLRDQADHPLGPIAGLHAALTHVNRPVLLLPCDMPSVSADLLRRLVTAWRTVPARPLVTTHFLNHEQLIEPLLAIYPPSILPSVAARLAAGQRSLWRLATEESLPQWPCPADLSAELLNLNDPAALQDFLHNPPAAARPKTLMDIDTPPA